MRVEKWCGVCVGRVLEPPPVLWHPCHPRATSRSISMPPPTRTARRPLRAPAASCVLPGALLLAAACVPPPRMCASEVDCGTKAACVAGRCVAQGATAAIDTARRMVVFPVDVAYIRRGADTSVASIATLGASSDPEASILLRFALSLGAEASVIEAYLLLERTGGVDEAPSAVVLHTERIVEPWDSRSVRWVRPPRWVSLGAPVTPVSPAAGPLVRLDVRTLIQRWRLRPGDDFGVAVRAEGQTASGVEFALAPMSQRGDDPRAAPAPPPLSPFDPHPVSVAAAAAPRDDLSGPRLELYVQ